MVPTKPADGPVLMLCLWISSAGPPGENCFLPCRGACQLSPPRHPEISQVVLQGLGKPWGGLRQLSPVLPLPPFAAVVLRAPRSPARSEATSGHRVGSCPHPVQGAGERRHFPPASGSPAPSFPVPSPYPPPLHLTLPQGHGTSDWSGCGLCSPPGSGSQELARSQPACCLTHGNPQGTHLLGTICVTWDVPLLPWLLKELKGTAGGRQA